MDSRFTEVLLSEQQERLIDEDVIDLVMRMGLDSEVPQYDGSQLVDGDLKVTCCSLAERELLVQNVGLMLLPDEVKLKAPPQEELPRRARVRMYLKTGKSQGKILQCLGRFNSSLRTDSWMYRSLIIDA